MINFISQTKMPVNERDIIDLLCTLAEEEKLVVTVKSSLKGGLIAGTTTAIGGLLLGPIGLAVGGVLGGSLATILLRGQFLPAVEVIATMPEEKRQLLTNKVERIMNSVDVTDAAVLAAVITGDILVRQRILEALMEHFKREMNMALTQRI